MVAKPSNHLPDYIQEYAFDFSWDNTLLWQLDITTQTMGIDQLAWHFDVRWLHTKNGRFDITPKQIMDNPDLYNEQYGRTMQSDLSYPIDIMFNKGNWLILDGLHRLMKSAILGKQQVNVRKIPRSAVPLITT